MATRLLNRALPAGVFLAALLAMAFLVPAAAQTLPADAVDIPEWARGISDAFLLMLAGVVLGGFAGWLRRVYGREAPPVSPVWAMTLGMAFGLFGAAVVVLDAAWPVWVAP